MLQSESEHRGRVEENPDWVQKEKVEAGATISTANGSVSRCCFSGGASKTWTDVAKATGLSTSVSIFLLTP